MLSIVFQIKIKNVQNLHLSSSNTVKQPHNLDYLTDELSLENSVDFGRSKWNVGWIIILDSSTEYFLRVARRYQSPKSGHPDFSRQTAQFGHNLYFGWLQFLVPAPSLENLQ